MGDAVSTLDRLTRERALVVTYNRAASQNLQGLWVINAMATGLWRIFHPQHSFMLTCPLTVAPSTNVGHVQSNLITIRGIGQARRVKQAKQRAAQMILAQLPTSSTSHFFHKVLICRISTYAVLGCTYPS